MSSKLRKTGKPVNRRAVECLWQNLLHLWNVAPLSFIELVRKARKRKHQIFTDPTTLHNLVALGFVDEDRGYCVHDSYRELIEACVEGKGLHMVLHRPFKDDDKPIAETVTLRNQITATPHLVDGVMNLLQHLHEEHYVAFAELVRHVRDNKAASKLFPGTLEVLLHIGAVEIIEWQTPVAALTWRFGNILASNPIMLLQNHQKLVVHDCVATILKIVATGHKGLDFNIQSPYQTEHAESNGDTAGQKKRVVTGEPQQRRSAMGVPPKN